MRKKIQRNEFYFPFPQKFQQQKLSLKMLQKDKIIRTQQEKLFLKHSQYRALQKICNDAQSNFELRKQKRILQFKQKKQQKILLSKQIFKLEIRKDQLASKEINNSIMKIVQPDMIGSNLTKQNLQKNYICSKKLKVIEAYLKCLPYTVGKLYQRIKFFGNLQIQSTINVWIRRKLDNMFSKSTFKQIINDRISKIVYFKKFEFRRQYIILCIREVNRQENTNLIVRNRSTRYFSSKYNISGYKIEESHNEQIYQIQIYSITGEYYHFSKQYTYDNLMSFASKINKSFDNISSIASSKDQLQIIPKKQKHRPSVADNLKKFNEIKNLQKNDVDEKLPQIQLKKITEKTVRLRQSEEQEKKDVDDQNDKSKIETSSLINSDSQEEDESAEKFTKRILIHSKSSFHQTFKSKNSKSTKLDLSRKFLKGYQQILFPKPTKTQQDFNPLANIIVPTNKEQIYFLQQYFQILPQRKKILEASIDKWRLKMRLQKELQKYIFYKTLKINRFYETEMGMLPNKDVDVLFIIKRQKQNCNDLVLYCDTIKSQNEPFKFSLKIQFYKAQIHEQKVQVQIKQKQRNSRIKYLKNSTGSRKSKEIKRKSSIKNSVIKQIDHEKSNFSKKKTQNEKEILKLFKLQMTDKFYSFIKQNLICLTKKQFISFEILVKRKLCFIRFQAQIKCDYYKKKYMAIESKPILKINYNHSTKILITTAIYPQFPKIFVYLEQLVVRSLEKYFEIYPIEYLSIIKNVCLQFNNCLNIKETNIKLFSQIQNKIQEYQKYLIKKQMDRPEKNKQSIRRFIMQLNLKVKMKQNLFYIKKINIKEYWYVLMIRKNKHLIGLLQCNVYHLSSRSFENSRSYMSQFKVSQQQPNCQVKAYNPTLKAAQKFTKYQTIYLMENYFDNLPKIKICQQFYIDEAAFLLKPKRYPTVHFIERLSAININSDEILKEIKQIASCEKQNYFKQNKTKILTNNRIKKLSFHQNSLIQQNPSIRERQHKRISIEQQNQKLLRLLQNQLLPNITMNFQLSKAKKSLQTSSKASMVDTGSHKNHKQSIYKIVNNAHDSIIYYSLIKNEDIFFYLVIYLVQKYESVNGKKSQQLFIVERQKLYRKQLQEANSTFILKRIAQWVKNNEGDNIIVKQQDQTINPTQKIITTNKEFDYLDCKNYLNLETILLPNTNLSIQINRYNQEEMSFNRSTNTLG